GDDGGGLPRRHRPGPSRARRPDGAHPARVHRPDGEDLGPRTGELPDRTARRCGTYASRGDRGFPHHAKPPLSGGHIADGRRQAPPGLGWRLSSLFRRAALPACFLSVEEEPTRLAHSDGGTVVRWRIMPWSGSVVPA